MKITFGNIQHILKLLTTTEWINKYDPKISLQKLQDKLNHENNPKKKQELDKAIKNIEKKIDSDKSYVVTLEHAEINTNEAQLLLANLHLLYDADPSYKTESQEALIQLLKLNFDKLNSPEIYKVKHHFYNENTLRLIPKDVENTELFYKLISKSKIISLLYTADQELNSTALTSMLSQYFGNEEDAINYLKSIDYTSSATIALSFQYNVPKNLDKEVRSFFYALNGYVTKFGKEILVLYANAELLPKIKFDEWKSNLEIQKLLLPETKQAFFAGSKGSEWVTSTLKNLVNEIRKEIISVAYHYPANLPHDILPYAEQLSELSLQVLLDESSFQKALEFIVQGKLKQSDKMPEINFLFKVGNKEYNFSKLSPSDMRGFVLGKFSNSCQSIGDYAEKCVLNGMGKDTAGFYIITDANGKIKAQSYAWLANIANQDKRYSLVLDSFEHLGAEDIHLFIPAMNQLLAELPKHNLQNLYVGTGGQTPELHMLERRAPVPVDPALYLYGDSDTVYNINSLMSKEDLATDLDSSKEQGLQYKSYQEVYDANTIISAELIIKHHASEKDYLLGHLEQFNALLKCITVSEYESFYTFNPQVLKYFVYYGRRINSLNDIGITPQYLWDTYWTVSDIAEDIIINTSSIIALHDAGMHIATLLSLYEHNFSIAITIVSNQAEIVRLLKNNISFDTIVDIYKADIHFMNWLIDKIDYTITALITNITMDTLKRLHDIDDTLAKTFVLEIQQVRKLVVTEVVTLNDLIQIAQDNPQLITRCIKQADLIIFLNMHDMPLSMLVKIYQINADLGLFVADNASNIYSLLRLGITAQELFKFTVHPQEIEAFKYLVVEHKNLKEIIENTSFQFKDLLVCNIKQLQQLLNNDISPNDLKIILQGQKKISDLSSLLDQIKNIGLQPDDQKIDSSCATDRVKRAVDSCLKEDEKFLYDPLEDQNMTTEQVKAHRHAEMVGLATTWELTKRQKHQKLQKAIQYHRNIGKIVNEGQDNWSTREKKILDRYHEYTHRISQEKQLLQEINNNLSSWHGHKVRMYDNSKTSLVVFKASQHFKIYSSDLDYQRLYRIDNISNEELNTFIDAFFMWKDGSSNHKLYTLSSNIPHNTLQQIHNTLSYPQKVRSDYKILETKKGSHIENVSLDIIHDLFALDGKPIEKSQLTTKFFKANSARLTLRVDKLHKALQYMGSQEKQYVFNLIKKYNIDGSWTKGVILDEHTSSSMDTYAKAVIKEIREYNSINLNKLSEISWASLSTLIKDHTDIGSEFGGKIIQNNQRIYNSLGNMGVIKAIGTQGLFFLPSIITAVNTNQYHDLVETGGMIAGDAAVNKLVESLAKYLPAERAALFGKLPITSPIFKALTIYSIVELHQELHDLPSNAPQKAMIKDKLLGQYATIGLICAEALGMETGPAWFVLMGIQLIVEAEDTRKMYKLDVSFMEALAISLGFEQAKLNSIMEERELVSIDLASPQALKTGYTIVQVPKVAKIEWQDISPDLIPHDVRLDLSNKAHLQSKDTTNTYSTIESGVYKLTQSYKARYINGGMWISPIPLVDHSSSEEQWQIKKVYVYPQISQIKFGQYTNNKRYHIESNNWFLDVVQYNDTTWMRVPQNLDGYVNTNLPLYAIGTEEGIYNALPIQYKRVGPTANIKDPVSRTDTGHTALYINQQVIKQSPNNINHIHFAFDPRRGDISLDITAQGLINMDKTNAAYLRSVGNNINYNSDKTYILQTTVSKIELHESVKYVDIYNNDNKGTVSIQSDNMRVISIYLIKHDAPCVISDSTKMTMIQFIPTQESSDQLKQYLVNGTMQNLNIGTWSYRHVTYNDITIKMNPDKKYLSIDLDGHFIRDKLEIGATNLEVLNVQGQIIKCSTLHIISNTQSFNTTLLGNIIVNDGTSTLTIRGLSKPEDIIVFSKSIDLNAIPSYDIKIGNMKNLLKNMPVTSTNQDIDHVNYNIDQDGKIILHTEHINFKFSSNGVHYHFNTPQHTKVSFRGTLDHKSAIFTNHHDTCVLDILDRDGNILVSEYTHYRNNAISIDPTAHITRVFDYTQKSGDMVISSQLDYGSRISIDTYKTHGILKQGRVYEFITSSGTTITHNFPQNYSNNTVNDVIYTIKDSSLYAIDGQGHKIDGNNLLPLGTSGNTANIAFANIFVSSTINCHNNDMIIDGITLHNVTPDTNIIFYDQIIPLDIIIDTLGCNIKILERNKRSVLQDGMQAAALEVPSIASSATAGSSWINNGIKAIGTLVTTLYRGFLLSSKEKHNDIEDGIIIETESGYEFEYIHTNTVNSKNKKEDTPRVENANSYIPNVPQDTQQQYASPLSLEFINNNLMLLPVICKIWADIFRNKDQNTNSKVDINVSPNQIKDWREQYAKLEIWFDKSKIGSNTSQQDLIYMKHLYHDLKEIYEQINTIEQKGSTDVHTVQRITSILLGATEELLGYQTSNFDHAGTQSSPNSPYDHNKKQERATTSNITDLIEDNSNNIIPHNININHFAQDQLHSPPLLLGNNNIIMD